MNEFILYFIEKNDETIFVYEEKRVIIKENYKRVIEIECLKKLITYKGRIEALRKRIGNGYNIPIFISNKICFIKVGKIYWVNYFKIKPRFFAEFQSETLWKNKNHSNPKI